MPLAIESYDTKRVTMSTYKICSINCPFQLGLKLCLQSFSFFTFSFVIFFKKVVFLQMFLSFLVKVVMVIFNFSFSFFCSHQKPSILFWAIWCVLEQVGRSYIISLNFLMILAGYAIPIIAQSRVSAGQHPGDVSTAASARWL